MGLGHQALKALQHFALQTLLDAEPHEQWPLAQAAGECVAELARLSDGFAAEWQWLCGELSGKANTHWPALQQLAEQGGEQPLAERLLARKGVTPDKIRVDLEPEQREHMMRITGRRTVPQIFIGELHVGGYDDLSALDRAGKLDALLAD